MIYALEIKSLIMLLNIEVIYSRAYDAVLLRSFTMLGERLIMGYNFYPQIYNLLALACATVLLLLLKKNSLNIIFILLTPVVMLLSYSFLIILNMTGSQILNFPNYYLFVFLFAFVLLYLKNHHVKNMLKILSLALIVFFYFCSYFWAVWGLRHEKVLKSELAKLEQVAYSQYEKGLPIFIIENINDWDKKLIKTPNVVKTLFSVYGYGQRRALSWGFNGSWYGFKNIEGLFFGSISLPIDNFELKLKIKKQANLLRSQGKSYPNYGSMFLYNGTIYVVGN